MKLIFVAILAVILGGPAVSQGLQTAVIADELVLDVRQASDVTLEQFLWKNRLIVVFADNALNPAFRTQMDLFNARVGALLERDVVVITDTDPATPSDIRIALRPRGFGFVLIDKDGVIKLRKPSPWDVREISRSIDKTPLRQQEVRDARELQ